MNRISAWLLGAAWGVVLASPFIVRARRVAVASRAVAMPAARKSKETRGAVQWITALFVTPLRSLRDTPLGRVTAALFRRRRARRVDAALAREVPVVLDLLGVAVGAGCTPYLAVEVAATWSPPRVGALLRSVLQACALGVAFDDALDAMAAQHMQLRPLADALLASERLGAPVGPVLARLAAEERTALRRGAEAHARKVPVKLLFPLVFLVLPAFVLLTVVPGLAAGLGKL